MRQGVSGRVVRNHWGVENKVFHVRDVTMGEDHCRVRKGFAPHLLSCLRNSLLNLLRLKGFKNIAETLRRHAALPLDALGLLKKDPSLYVAQLDGFGCGGYLSMRVYRFR
jgi:hypothetical protein